LFHDVLLGLISEGLCHHKSLSLSFKEPGICGGWNPGQEAKFKRGTKTPLMFPSKTAAASVTRTDCSHEHGYTFTPSEGVSSSRKAGVQVKTFI
jgi:hypothetical protein